MKYTNIYTRLMFLLALQRASAVNARQTGPAVPAVGSAGSSSESESDDSTTNTGNNTDINNINKSDANKSDAKPPPAHQDIPRLITEKERVQLLDLIRADKHAEIVAFFKENDLIDYPLIRFTDASVYGYTPLAAAVWACSADTAKTLAPVQFDKLWTSQLGPRHSLAELAAKHCPSLLSETITDQKDQIDHPLAKMIEKIDVAEITQILASILANDKDEDAADKEIIVDWIASKFAYNAPEVENPNAITLRPAGSKADKKSDPDTVSTYGDFNLLIDSWISSGHHKTDTLLSFLKTKIYPISHGMYSQAIVRIFQLNGDLDEFKDALLHFTGGVDAEMHTARALINTLTFIEPAQILSFQAPLLNRLRNEVKALKINHTNYHSKSFNRYLPLDPRIDTVVALYDLKDVECVLPGNDANEDEKFNPPNPQNLNLHDMLLQAYIEDKPEALKTIIETDYKFWSLINFDDIRFNFKPYRLSPVKAAIVLNKPAILKYLLSRPNASIYVTTRDQLTALEMAACYQPDFLVEHLLTIGGNCSKRLRATNHVIGMFKDTVTHICPTGAANAPQVLKALMNEDIACMDLISKDYVIEAFKLDYPADLIIGLHSTNHFKRNGYYLELAAKRGDIKLYQYFFGKMEEKDDSVRKQSLTTWVRYTDGKQTENNVQMLEFLLQSSSVDKNAKNSQTGATALSHAVQRSLTWIVKRLMLDPKIDVNTADSLTSTTPLQHALKIFHNEATLIANRTPKETIVAALEKKGIPAIFVEPLFTKSGEARDNFGGLLEAFNISREEAIDILSNSGISRELIEILFKEPEDPIYDMAKQLNRIIGNKYFTWLESETSEDKYMKIVFNSNEMLENIKGDIKDTLIAKFNLAEFVATLAANTIVTDLKINDFLNSIKSKTGFEVVPLIADLCDSVEIYFGSLDLSRFGIAGTDTFKTELTIAHRHIESILKNIFIVYYNKARILKLENKARNHIIQGILHNVLLAHPAVDTTITDSSNVDALGLSKSRAALLKGDIDAADEMYRAHVRVRNIDAIHDSKKNFGRIAFGIVSTVFIGTVSAGLIKWML